MVFRLFELSFGEVWGLTFFTFLWDDDSSYSILAWIHSDDLRKTHVSIMLYTFMIDWDYDEEEDE